MRASESPFESYKSKRILFFANLICSSVSGPKALIQEGQIQLNDLDNYKPLDKPIVQETHTKVSRLISELRSDNYIDDMTFKWLSQTPNPPRTPEFYTLTKIHKPTLVGRPIISGCSGPTEKISAFGDTLL